MHRTLVRYWAAMATMADLQRAPGLAAPAGPARLPLQVERVRTFDTPEFAGMTFLEVEARSALNRVRGMPFPYSINPYRGCSHACSYCLAGETPILMADGRTKPLAEVRAGDRVYGTVQHGSRRRYAITEVLDHWSTTKPALLVTLADGTRLVTSGDHRFLTGRGWRHVSGARHGSAHPHLSGGDELMGSGRFTPSPKDTPEYRRGYVCGVIGCGVTRGDADLGPPPKEGPDGTSAVVDRCRLAFADGEALQRVRQYLGDSGVETRHFVVRSASAGREPVHAVRTCARRDEQALRRLIARPCQPSLDWAKGFLAGVYDAGGRYRCGVLRISNSDEATARLIVASLRRLNLDAALETGENGYRAVRVGGGLPDHVHFFHAVDPAVTRKRTIEGRVLEGGPSLRVVAVEPLGLSLPLFDITTGTGDFIADGVVSHNCFARPTHAYLNLSPLGDFERTVVVKTNLVEVLRRELARPSWRGEHVAMGTNTDPYQRCEGRYALMPGVITALAESRTPFSILTKGTLVTRDLGLLVEAAGAVPVGAALTVGMLDERLWRAAEPGTPSPKARLAAVRSLNDAGIPTGVMLAPIMPGLNDDREQLAGLVEQAVLAGAVHVTPIVLHLRPGVREVFWPWLTREHPQLVDRYTALYRRSDAARAYRDAVCAFVAQRRRA
ncbi:MAG: intein-containing Rv2578c family radical SAM protein, partial [Euzebyales bacterium]|nr:intein-containing Rv2578c family radical SAM protein [Euzebyales bacterium]MBA3621733.1 intein-containing Rv2578c family radical SAM protein [Euzebyales bacterium]